MKIVVTITKKELEDLVIQELQCKMPEGSFKRENVKIETKSTQNYKSEWESADYRAVYQGDV